MFLNLLFVVMVLGQAMEIWLRVSVIAENMLESQMIEDFAQIAETRFSVGYDDNLKIFIFENNQMTLSIQIQDKLGKWILILIQEEQILVDGKTFKITKQDQLKIQFFQIMRNQNNFFIEVQKDEKYNNFLFQQNHQQFKKTTTFNTFISDQDAIITFWFRFLIDYNTRNSVYFKYDKNHKKYIFYVLQIERLVIIIPPDQNEYKEQQEILINGMIWNQIQITLKYDQIYLELMDKFGQIIVICKRGDLGHIINKELAIEYQGLYIGHYSIQYKVNEYYCSPGCINCINQKCVECQNDQYLFKNQCTCQKFYQSQNVNGYCVIFADLYEKKLEVLDNDLLHQKCQFGYILVIFQESQLNKCIKCPLFQNQMCSHCLTEQGIFYKQFLYCDFIDEQLIIEKQNQKIQQYSFEYDQFILDIKSKAYIIPKKQKKAKIQIKIRNKIQQSIEKHYKNLQFTKLVDQTQKFCPFNCECSLMSDQKLYCMNLIDNQNYIQSSKMGIPLFLNSEINIINLEIIIIELMNRLCYEYNKQNYNQLSIILNDINIDSIIMAGVHSIQFLINFQSFNYFNQVIYDLNQELSKLRDSIFVIRQSRFYLIPSTYLTITSSVNKLLRRQDWKCQIKGFDKLTLTNISFFSSKQDLVLNGSIIILKNLYFNNTYILFQITCKKLIIENVVFENVTGSNILFNISSMWTYIQNTLITNCTSKAYNIFQMDTPEYLQEITINGLLIQYSKFVDVSIIYTVKEILVFLETRFLLSNFILNDCKFQDSFVIKSTQIPYFESIFNFKISKSLIRGALFAEFYMNIIDNFAISNCTFTDIEYIFILNYQNQNYISQLKNIFLDQIIFNEVTSLFFFWCDIQLSFFPYMIQQWDKFWYLEGIKLLQVLYILKTSQLKLQQYLTVIGFKSIIYFFFYRQPTDYFIQQLIQFLLNRFSQKIYKIFQLCSICNLLGC